MVQSIRLNSVKTWLATFVRTYRTQILFVTLGLLFGAPVGADLRDHPETAKDIFQMLWAALVFGLMFSGRDVTSRISELLPLQLIMFVCMILSSTIVSGGQFTPSVHQASVLFVGFSVVTYLRIKTGDLR